MLLWFCGFCSGLLVDIHFLPSFSGCIEVGFLGPEMLEG